MNEHPQFEEDFDLYALGILEGDDWESIELHLVHCADCERKVSEARGRMAMLALAAPALTPPLEMRERILHRIRAQAWRGTMHGAALWPRRLAAALAVASIVLAITSGGLWRQNGQLARRMRELETAQEQKEAQAAEARAVLDVLTAADTVKVALVPGGVAKPVPQGRALYNAGKGRLLFYAANLPALPSGRTYELWLIPTVGAPINAGVFEPDQKGNGQVLLPPLEPGLKPKAFAVTVEPAGGVPMPTGPMVMVGAAS
ncbi:MAG TPA: anti-sigma factor [Terriglobia bacterium]|nr:anti-sigma factor [Terriglobia bacterium]